MLSCFAIVCDSIILFLPQALGLLEDRETVIPEDEGPTEGIYYVARDAAGPVRTVSSDILHALFYLNPGTFQLLCLMCFPPWFLRRSLHTAGCEALFGCAYECGRLHRPFPFYCACNLLVCEVLVCAIVYGALHSFTLWRPCCSCVITLVCTVLSTLSQRTSRITSATIWRLLWSDWRRIAGT